MSRPVRLPADQSSAGVIDAVDPEAQIGTIEIRQEGDRRTPELTVEVPRPHQPCELVAKLADADHVLEVRWAD